MKGITGRIFDISRGCVDDGPGLRTVVFLKGCRLLCPWCHNIEGISFEPEISYDISRCIGCKRCLEACPRDWPFDVPNAWRTGCKVQARCTAVCPSKARRLVGRSYGVDELVSEVADENDFFAGTGGGVTFSGGEPLAQPEFLFACADALGARDIHVAVETAGLWPSELIEDLINRIDLVLFDLKHSDPEKFKNAIGKDNTIILNNLKELLSKDIPVEVRIALIPGFNSSDHDLVSISSWLKTGDRLPPVRLLPFHRLAISKQGLFGRTYPYADFKPISEKELCEAAGVLAREGIPIVEGTIRNTREAFI